MYSLKELFLKYSDSVNMKQDYVARVIFNIISEFVLRKDILLNYRDSLREIIPGLGERERVWK